MFRLSRMNFASRTQDRLARWHHATGSSSLFQGRTTRGTARKLPFTASGSWPISDVSSARRAMAMLLPSDGEEVLKRPQGCCQSLRRYRAKPLRQANLVHRTNLIQQDQTLGAAVRHGNSELRRKALGGHGSDDDCAQMIIQPCGRHNHARARFF